MISQWVKIAEKKIWYGTLPKRQENEKTTRHTSPFLALLHLPGGGDTIARVHCLCGAYRVPCAGLNLWNFMTYQEFILSKKHTSINYGIDPNWFPDGLFDYQTYVAEYAIRKGRCAMFLDTGLGKTVIELTIAKNYIRATNKPVLIITPLAVAFQFIKEAKKFSIDDIQYSKDGKYNSHIVVCNYERLDKFNCADFDCVILDESSILKNFDGAIKNQVTSFLKKVKYRYLFTATPSPNDYIELGTSSEALGYLGYTDMLTRFFKNNNNNTVKIGQIAMARQGVEWYLKSHAETDFWRWVASWSISCRKPSDLGFSDELHRLPKLFEIETIVKNKKPLAVNGQEQLFNMPAMDFREIKAEVRATIQERCEMAVSKCLEHNISFCWVNLNDEGDKIESLLPNSIQISGEDDIEKKEEAIQWFIGDKCICDSKYFGLNWQEKQLLKCGNLNTPEIEKINTKHLQTKEKEEKRRVALLTKIKSICAGIIKETRISLKGHLSKMLTEIEKDESDMPTIKILEKQLRQKRSNGAQAIEINNEQELLESMGLLQRAIIECLNNKTTGARFVFQLFQMIIKQSDYISTIVTHQEKLEGYFVQLVTLGSENSEIIQNCLTEQQCTCGHISGVRRLISKTKIFGFGLNLQHCNHTTYFPTYSYEQYYQSIRRFWRFGQKKDVIVDLVLSDGQSRIMQSLIVKKNKANQMFEKLSMETNSEFKITTKGFDKKLKLPNFITA